MSETTTALAELEATLDAAQTDERTTQAKAREAGQRARQLGDELAALAAADPELLGPDGTPKPKTKAAKLADELRALTNPTVSWQQRLDAAAARTFEAKREVARYKSAHVEELAAELEPAARQAAVDLEQALDAVDAALVRFSQVEQEFSAVLVYAQGLDAHTDIPSLHALQQFRAEAVRLRAEGIRAPLPRSLFPAEGERPPRTKRGDGWVPTHQAELEAAREAA